MAAFFVNQTEGPMAGIVQVLGPPSMIPGAQWQITGDESQILEIILNPGERLDAEPGTMVHSSDGLRPDITTGGCADACCRSCVAAEAFFRIKFENNTQQQQHVGLTPNFPGKVIPIDLGQFGGRMTTKSGAFMAALNCQPTFSFRFPDTVGAACCGGHGLILNDINGSGTIFLNASGCILQRFLTQGEELLCDTHSVVAFQPTCHMDVRVVGNCMMCCCGGEGLFNTCLTGPGTVILQSMPLRKMALALGFRPRERKNNGTVAI